jgi:copper chaperone CopZ
MFTKQNDIRSNKENNMNTVKYSIPNINCGHCVHTIQTEVSDLAGVKSVQADLQTRTAMITFEPPATEDRIKALLEEINYPVAG